jgi:hypothetical protein
MRMLTVLVLLATGISACQTPQREQYPAVIGHADYTMCGMCGGTFIYIIENRDTLRYRADLTPPFNQPQQNVFVRYEQDKTDELKTIGRWITISSIRLRD